MKLNSFIRFDIGTDDDYFWFCVRLFDPLLAGFTEAEKCERIIDLLFDNQDEEGNTTEAPAVKLPSGKNAKKKVSIRSQAENASSFGDDDSIGEDNIEIDKSVTETTP